MGLEIFNVKDFIKIMLYYRGIEISNWDGLGFAERKTPLFIKTSIAQGLANQSMMKQDP